MGPDKRHVVFSNAPGCAGIGKANNHGAPVVLLDSKRYFQEMWGKRFPGMVSKEIALRWPS
jgi:hypothetical protein